MRAVTASAPQPPSLFNGDGLCTAESFLIVFCSNNVPSRPFARMLSNFFQLNGQFRRFDEAELVSHFRESLDLRSVLYGPDNWPNSSLRRLKSATFENVSLSKTTFKECTFINCKFTDCLFIGSIFESVEFHRCTFINCNFYKSAFESCYIDPRTISFDRKYRHSAANVGVSLYHELYENAARSRQPDFLMFADIEFRRWKRWQLEYDQKTSKISVVERYAKAVSSWIYEVLTGFGYRPLRFIIITIVFFNLLSLINMGILPETLKQDGEVVHTIDTADAVFYTYSMLTALGFSTIVPVTGLGKIMAVAQALLGIGWLGLFTSLLVKRFIR
jgi:hypothetical protein